MLGARMCSVSGRALSRKIRRPVGWARRRPATGRSGSSQDRVDGFNRHERRATLSSWQSAIWACRVVTGPGAGRPGAADIPVLASSSTVQSCGQVITCGLIASRSTGIFGVGGGQASSPPGTKLVPIHGPGGPTGRLSFSCCGCRRPIQCFSAANPPSVGTPDPADDGGDNPRYWPAQGLHDRRRSQVSINLDSTQLRRAIRRPHPVPASRAHRPGPLCLPSPLRFGPVLERSESGCSSTPGRGT